SSRRRHTRSDRDWSSDVCSSDLCQVLILGCGLGLYQMTSLMLGTAGSRQLDLSLSIPTVESRDFAEPLATKAGVIGSLVTPLSRSEERRVGKEGKYGGKQDSCRI